jgi:hypothetical protein
MALAAFDTGFTKSVSVHLEMMFTRSLFMTADT